MRRLLVTLSIIVAAGLVMSCKNSRAGEESTPETAELPEATGEPIEEIDLERHMWEHRTILLFAPSPKHREYVEMRREVSENPDGVEERDLVVYHLFFDRPGRFENRPVTVEATQKLRRRMAVLEDAFTFILVGKDGTQKMRAEEAVDVETVFSEIDSMPMRQREMKEGE